MTQYTDEDVPAKGLAELARQDAVNALRNLRDTLDRCLDLWPAQGDQETIQDAVAILALASRSIVGIGASGRKP